MAKFTDHTGHDWQVAILFGHRKALREDHGINFKATPKEFFESVAAAVTDTDKLYDLLLLLCADEIKKRELDPEQFAFLLSADTQRQAIVAVTDALFDFYRGPNVGMEMSEAIRATMTTSDQKLGDKIRNETPSLISKLLAGNSPESSAATPTPEACAS